MPTVPEHSTVNVVTDADIATRLKSMNGKTYIDRRDTAIVRLLVDAVGIRVGETAAADTDDLDPRERGLLTHGKGSKNRFGPIAGDKTWLALRQYLRVRNRPGAASCLALFLAARSTRTDGWRLTDNGIWRMLDRPTRDAGLATWAGATTSPKISR